jgi:DNA helicase-2/ATP-dependent DNA helicase PcrA
VERHGEEPVVLGFPDEAAILGKIALDLAEFRQKGYRSVGIFTRVKQEAKEVYQALKGKPNVHAVLSGEEGFSSGAVVMPAYLAKGLEFDAVIIHDAGGGNYAREEERLLLYTACTRALHELRVYHTGTLTPLFGIENETRERREG